MIRSVKKTLDSTIQGTDGEIGQVGDCYFDDKEWVIRYWMVQTGDWAEGRRVLISPISVNIAEWSGDQMRARVARTQVQSAPQINTSLPISRQVEIEFNNYYGFPFYWGGDAIWGPGMTPGALAAATLTAPILEQENTPVERAANAEDSNLRSADAAFGLKIQARDGDVGHVADFLFDDESFRINFLVVDTSNWWSGKKVIVPPTWVTKVDWAAKQVWVDLKRETIRASPEFDLAALNQK